MKKGIVSNDMDWAKSAHDPGISVKDNINLSEYSSIKERYNLLSLLEMERKNIT